MLTKPGGGNPGLEPSFSVFDFWGFFVLKEEAVWSPSSHFTDEETETPRDKDVAKVTQ